MALYDPEVAVGSKIERVLILIGTERIKQDIMKVQGRFKYTCADVPGMDDYEKLACLMEELGEVAQEALTLDGTRENRGALGTREALRNELIQVAAVAAAWIEALL